MKTADNQAQNSREKAMKWLKDHIIAIHIVWAIFLGVLGMVSGLIVGDRLFDFPTGLILGVVAAFFAALASYVILQFLIVLFVLLLLIVFPSRRLHAIIAWGGGCCIASIRGYQLQYSFLEWIATTVVSGVVLATICEVLYRIWLLGERVVRYLYKAQHTSPPREDNGS